MSGLRGVNFAADKRSSDRVWDARPHAKNIAARAAWDHFAKTGIVDAIRLNEGVWQCIRPGSTDITDTAEAVNFRRLLA